MAYVLSLLYDACLLIIRSYIAHVCHTVSLINGSVLTQRSYRTFFSQAS